MKRRIVEPFEVSEPREKLSSLGSIAAGSEAAGVRERPPTASPRFATSAVSAPASSWLLPCVMSEVSQLLDVAEREVAVLFRNLRHFRIRPFGSRTGTHGTDLELNNELNAACRRIWWGFLSVHTCKFGLHPALYPLRSPSRMPLPAGYSYTHTNQIVQRRVLTLSGTSTGSFSVRPLIRHSHLVSFHRRRQMIRRAV